MKEKQKKKKKKKYLSVISNGIRFIDFNGLEI